MKERVQHALNEIQQDYEHDGREIKAAYGRNNALNRRNHRLDYIIEGDKWLIFPVDVGKP